MALSTTFEFELFRIAFTFSRTNTRGINVMIVCKLDQNVMAFSSFHPARSQFGVKGVMQHMNPHT